MTVVGIDDTDSRVAGMCTTYVGASVAEALRADGAHVERKLLVRLNPAAPHKTRGNAAIAVHTDAEPERAFELARELIRRHARTDERGTQPGLVVAPDEPEAVPDAVAAFGNDAVRTLLDREHAEALLAEHGYRHAGWHGGRGLIGALAAVGAWRALPSWTYEAIAYREPGRWGTPRVVDGEDVVAAATDAYPTVWDTVDRVTGDLVCVPRTPCPVLYGIRGDREAAVVDVARRIEGEPVERIDTFVTNQGTDAHLTAGRLADVEAGRSYRVPATVAGRPETRRGGHVFVDLVDEGASLRAAAFEPTKHFRRVVRALRPGDRIVACGEVTDGTIKLEKLAIRDLEESTFENPTCPACGRSMPSAGRRRGFRCRGCGRTAEAYERRPLDRSLEPGWYEVPPCARRHVAKPLVRGGFDGPVHVQR